MHKPVVLKDVCRAVVESDDALGGGDILYTSCRQPVEGRESKEKHMKGNRFGEESGTIEKIEGELM